MIILMLTMMTSHSEWESSNLDHLHNADQSRHTAERIRAEVTITTTYNHNCHNQEPHLSQISQLSQIFRGVFLSQANILIAERGSVTLQQQQEVSAFPRCADLFFSPSC